MLVLGKIIGELINLFLEIINLMNLTLHQVCFGVFKVNLTYIVNLVSCIPHHALHCTYMWHAAYFALCALSDDILYVLQAA